MRCVQRDALLASPDGYMSNAEAPARCTFGAAYVNNSRAETGDVEDDMKDAVGRYDGSCDQGVA